MVVTAYTVPRQATARAFNMFGSGGARDVKKYDRQVRDGTARCQRVGTTSTFSDAIEAKISLAFDGKKETRSYREAAKEVNIPKSTLFEHATKKMNYRCLGHRSGLCRPPRIARSEW